jgi:flavin reductase (DIM6/NTAB) family NADH-FMN oxidoreductase RutF
VIVTTLDSRGEPKGLTTQTYIGVSTEPPIMLVSIEKTSRTLSSLQNHQRFVLNFLREGSEDLATLFASKSDEKYKGVPWEPSAEAGGAPILREAAVAYAACAVTDAIEVGDHWLFVARVEAGELMGGTPLMYYRRTYAAWPEKRPAPPLGGGG